jgi:hypothetical protein
VGGEVDWKGKKEGHSLGFSRFVACAKKKGEKKRREESLPTVLP